jgi:hypothetical protein
MCVTVSRRCRHDHDHDHDQTRDGTEAEACVRLTTILAVVIVVALLVSGLCAAALTMGPRGWTGYQRLALGGAILAGHATMAVAMVVVLQRGRLRRLMVSGLVTTVIALIAWIDLVWAGGVGPDGDWSLRVAVTLSAVAGMCMIVGVQRCQPSGSRPTRWLGYVTLLFSAALLLVLLYLVWVVGLEQAYGRSWGVLARSVPALAMLIMMGMLANVVLVRLGDLGIVFGAAPAGPPATIICPRCGRRQVIRLGGDRCGICSLRVRIRLP